MKQVLTLLWLVSYAGLLSSQQITISPYLQDLEEASVIVMWEAASPGSGSVVYGLTPFDLSLSATSSSTNFSGDYQLHTAVVTGLESATKYYYRVNMAEGQMSALRSFVTLSPPEANKGVQLMVISDMQRDNSQPTKYTEIIENGIVAKTYEDIGSDLTDLEAVLVPGDLVSTGGNVNQWRSTYFGASDSLSGYVPFYPVPGNHEYFGNGLINFKRYFSLPTNGASAAMQDECWYKDISNVRIIGLNSNSGSSDRSLQLAWLDTILTQTCTDEHIDFVFAELHHPYKSELWTPGENDFTGMVIDSLAQFSTECSKASIHFFGHTHAYSRGQSRDHKHLWVNAASAGGAIDNWGEFPNADYKEFVKSQDEYGFVYLDVQAGDDPTFTMQRYSLGDQDVVLDNVLRDEITIINKDISPSQPVNIYPIGDTVKSYCLTLQASQFYGLEDSLQGAHWQIATDSFMQGIVQEDWWQSENFYNEVDLQSADDLTDATFPNLQSVGKHYWRVRYRNQNLEWSPWSASTAFVVENSIDTLTTNLLLNTGAEQGVANWTGDIEALENSECGSVDPYQGSFNFAVGGVCSGESSFGSASQEIDLSPYAGQIAAGDISLSYGGYLRNFNGNDLPEMYVEFYQGQVLVGTSPTIGSTVATWSSTFGIVAIPSNADRCVIYLPGTRTAGTDNDSYFDELAAFLIRSSPCMDCLGNSGVDKDDDGYCSDIDCDDTNDAIYPGALELCDGLDNNCDGLAELGDTVAWTGLGDGVSWHDSLNWDQQFLPLPCQHVVIVGGASVLVNDHHQCLSLEVETAGMLTLQSGSTLIINSTATNDYASVIVDGSMIVNGLCSVKQSNSRAFEVSGVLINNSNVSTEAIAEEDVMVLTGGMYESNGKTIIR